MTDPSPPPDPPQGGRLGRLRSALEDAYPEAARVYDDVYLSSVLAAPSRKDPSKPRTLAYARDKMLAALKWRRSVGVRLARLLCESQSGSVRGRGF